MRDRMPEFEMPSEDDLERAALVRREADLVRGRDVADLAADDAARAAAHAQWASVERGPVQPEPRSEGSVRPPNRTTGWRGRVLALVARPAVAFAGGIAVAAGAALAWPVVQAQMDRGTEAEVQRIVDDYVAALDAGDLRAAMALEGLDPEEADLDVLAAGVRPVEPVTIECGEPSLGVARASVACTVGDPGWGGLESSRIDLERDGAWRIASGFAVEARIQSTLGTLAAIDGVDLADEVRSGERDAWLYPGQYAAGIDPPEGMIARGPQRLAVTSYGAFSTGELRPDGALLEAMEAEAADFAAACAAGGDPRCAAFGSDASADPDAYDAQLGAVAYEAPGARSTSYAVDVRGPGPRVRILTVEVRIDYDEALESYELAAGHQRL